jgi:hypothetical protein
MRPVSGTHMHVAITCTGRGWGCGGERCRAFARCLHPACTRRAPRAPFLPSAQGSDEESEASDAAQSRPTSTDDPRTTAAAIARFEATVAPHIATEPLSEATLEDLRLQMPALRPVGCWCTECARLSSRMQHKAP